MKLAYLLLILFLIPCVYADEYERTMSAVLGIDIRHYTTEDMIFLIALPFIGVSSLLYGIIMKIGFFRGIGPEETVSMIIAVVITYSLLPTGVLPNIVLGIWATAGTFAAMVFALAIFLAGIAFLYAARAAFA